MGTSGAFEQKPATWRETLWETLRQALAALAAADHTPREIFALSVTSTSGTLCLVDAAHQPVGPAIMYSDNRSASVASIVQAAGARLATKLGTRFSASFALTKLYWLQQRHPERLERARWCLSPTDLVIGWLSGEWGQSDWTNALKWGYDVVDERWPEFIARDLGLPAEKLPQVGPPGRVVGRVATSIAAELGLSPETLVVSGATDGMASQIASGAVAPGEWNSTLGTTLVVKGVSEALLRDPLGRIYCHRHPDGYWAPGGASSTGADCLTLRFAGADLDALNAQALEHTPTDLVVYPLVRRGERLPFSVPEAEGFSVGDTSDHAVWFTAHLEGMAFVERLCFQVLADLGARIGDTIHVAGGAVQSEAGLRIRADVLGKRLIVPVVAIGAMGAAILAARGCLHDSVAAAAGAMVRPAHIVEPHLDHCAVYAERYDALVDAFRRRGYVP